MVHIPTEITALEEAFEKYHDRLNCVLVEPLLQGAGGMRMYDVSFLKKARELCDQYGVLLVFDEVATGFGRTGNRFVADLVLPDILVLGKALTGGYIGHAATVANRKVFEGFYDDVPEHALMHGPTFMGNALACSGGPGIDRTVRDPELHGKDQKDRSCDPPRDEGLHRPQDPRSPDHGWLRLRRSLRSGRIKRISGVCLQEESVQPSVLNYLYAMVPYVIQEDELVQVLQCMKDWFAR